MKKIKLMIACCLFANVFCIAQEFPDYGVVSEAENNLKQCAFDKDANAVVLIHEAYSDYDDRHRLITTYHVRIKILKENGISYANVSIPFYQNNDFEQIDLIEGMTINMSDIQQMNILDKKSIYIVKAGEGLGKVVFAFPAVKPGSIIDYKYRSIMRNYSGLQDWYFQNELPVLTSKYTLIMLPRLEFAYKVNKADEIPITIKKENIKGGVYFEMHNIPALGDEPYMDARSDYLQKVIFQLSGYKWTGDFKKNYMSSWNELSQGLLMSDEFGRQLNKNVSGISDFIKQTKTLASEEEKMKAVFEYVRSNMNWNGDYSIYSLTGVKDAWQNKSGNSATINLLLINLLKETSLEAYPMLVSERFHGKINSAYPFIDQFNSVYACVIIHNKKYYLDATDKFIPAHLTPFNILNTTAFIVNHKAGGLINITNESAQYKEDIIANLELTDDGAVSGDIAVKSNDYARVIKMSDYKAGKSKFLDKYFTVAGTSISGKDLEIFNTGNDSMAFLQHCNLSGKLNVAGEYIFLPLNLFTGFEKNPFINDNRFSNINFGYRRNINLNLSIQLPAGYAIEDVPKPVMLTTPEKDIIFIRQVMYDKQDNSIRCLMQFEFKESLYEKEMYPTIKQLYQKMADYLKEPVILKKK